MIAYFLYLFLCTIFIIINLAVIKVNLNQSYLHFLSFFIFLSYPRSILYLLSSFFFCMGSSLLWVLLFFSFFFLLLSCESPSNLILPLNMPVYVELSELISSDNLKFSSLFLDTIQSLPKH